MPSPFPGMDPYLENPAIWPGVHSQLINAAARREGLALRPPADERAPGVPGDAERDHEQPLLDVRVRVKLTEPPVDDDEHLLQRVGEVHLDDAEAAQRPVHVVGVGVVERLDRELARRPLAHRRRARWGARHGRLRGLTGSEREDHVELTVRPRPDP